MKRKKFNLKDFVSNKATPVETRDERKARIVCTDAKGKYPVVALITFFNHGKMEIARNYDIFGNWYLKTKFEEDEDDLFFSESKKLF